MGRVQTDTTDAFEPDWRDAAPFDQVHLHLRDGTVRQHAPVCAAPPAMPTRRWRPTRSAPSSWAAPAHAGLDEAAGPGPA
jgi:hypothetical protein